MCRAENRFLHEYCSKDPSRLFGVATLPMHAPEEAAAELERCVESYGFVAAMIHPKPNQQLTLVSPQLEPVWQVAERLGTPICLHPTDGRFQPMGFEHLFANFWEHCQLGFAWQSQLALVQVLSTDLLRRHPRLRFAILESDIGWLPSLLDHMDHRFTLQRSYMDAPVTEPPSELFARHVVIAGEAEERILGTALELLPPGTFMFSTDYPHHESEFPDTVTEVLQRPDLPDQLRDAYLSENARAFYRLP
jgi:predicted TIM-barrel fold metal-dependent hydrolase